MNYSSPSFETSTFCISILQETKFPWHPLLPFRIWNRYTPTLWVSFPGRWIVNDLCCHAVWLRKNHNPWRERERQREVHTHTHTNVDTNTPRSWRCKWDGLVGSGGSHAVFPLSGYDNPNARHDTPTCTCSLCLPHTHARAYTHMCTHHKRNSDFKATIILVLEGEKP